MIGVFHFSLLTHYYSGTYSIKLSPVTYSHKLWNSPNLCGNCLLEMQYDFLCVTTWPAIETDKRVATPIPFVFSFGLQNMWRHMCCRAIKTTIKGVAVITYQALMYCLCKGNGLPVFYVRLQRFWDEMPCFFIFILEGHSKCMTHTR